VNKTIFPACQIQYLKHHKLKYIVQCLEDIYIFWCIIIIIIISDNYKNIFSKYVSDTLFLYSPPFAKE